MGLRSVLNCPNPDMPYANKAKAIVHGQGYRQWLSTVEEIWSYPDFWAQSGWTERFCELTSGNGLNNYCQARLAIRVSPPRTIDGSSKPSSGSCAPALLGAKKGYPSSFQSPESTRLRSASLPRSLSGRAILRPHQTLQTHRHPLRQAGQVLPVIYSSSVYFRLVGLIENRP